MVHPTVRFWKRELSNISPTAEIGEGSVIHGMVTIMDGVKIGTNVRIQSYAYLPPGVIIGDDVFIGPGVIFTNDPTMQGARNLWEPVPITVEDGVKIGAGAILLAGIRIGAFSVIGANSFVTRDVPAGELWAGSPARYIRKA